MRNPAERAGLADRLLAFELAGIGGALATQFSLGIDETPTKRGAVKP